MKIAVKMDPKDNVAVVMQAVDQGDSVAVAQGAAITALQPIGRGHKMAVTPIQAGDFIVKYGVPIGKASCDIPVGAHVHVHNVLDITREVNAVQLKG